MKTLIMQTNSECNTMTDKPYLGFPGGEDGWERNNLTANRSIACVIIEAPDGYEIVTGREGAIPDDYLVLYCLGGTNQGYTWLPKSDMLYVQDKIYARPIKKETPEDGLDALENTFDNFLTKISEEIEKWKQAILESDKC